MSTFEDRLALIEDQIQKIVEGGAGVFFPGYHLPDMAASQFTKAIRDNLRVLPDGELAAPDRLVLRVSPSEYELCSQERWLRELECSLREIGQQQGVKFPEGDFLRVEVGAELDSSDLYIQPEITSNFVSETSALTAEAEPSASELPRAFLIVDGTRVFPVDQAAVNIGRRPDNHLVIDDGRVSRLHAQLRFINGEFFIFDLDSMGGTLVNGERVSQCRLRAGDVISLAGLPMVFGLEAASLGETQDFNLLE